MRVELTMGQYLDMVRSTRTNPNENYPREILQLFSIGLFMLNQDGTRQLDQQGQPIATYSQDKVNNFSKVFTGFRAGGQLGILVYGRPAGRRTDNTRTPTVKRSDYARSQCSV